MMVVIDNYDSFTYNLVQYFSELGARLRVFRNDAIDIPRLQRLRPDRLVISPGPCTPNEAGISVAAIKAFAGRIPILGVCLGHQSIAAAFGGRIVRAKRLMHGKTSEIFHDNRGVFRGLSQPMIATRYHSLLAERASLPECLEVSAWTEAEEIMGLRHKTLAIEGVQFHPESILTVEGKKLLANFLSLGGKPGLTHAGRG
jgi:anthranilate synthase component 2